MDRDYATAERMPDGPHMAAIRDALTRSAAMAREVQALANKLFGPVPTPGSGGKLSSPAIISGLLPEMADVARDTCGELDAAFAALHRINEQL